MGKRIDSSIFGVSLAVGALGVGVSQFSIIQLIFELTGVKIPTWAAWVLLGLGAAAAIGSFLTGLGIVTTPGVLLTIINAIKAGASISA